MILKRFPGRFDFNQRNEKQLIPLWHTLLWCGGTMLLQTPCFSPPHTGRQRWLQPEHGHPQGPRDPCDIHSRFPWCPLRPQPHLPPSLLLFLRLSCCSKKCQLEQGEGQKHKKCDLEPNSWLCVCFGPGERLRLWHGRRVIPACHLSLAARWC